MNPVSGSTGKLFREAAPLGILAAVVLAVVLVRHAVDALFMLSLGPVFAAAVGEFVSMLVTGGLALVACAVLEVYRHMETTLPGLLALITVAGAAAAGVAAGVRARRRKQEVAKLAAIAEVAQQLLLRPVPTQAGPVMLAVRYISASSGARIGGDLYETVTGPGGLRMIIGDVQGKGLPAVQTAATVLCAFRESAFDAPGLAMIAERIETSLTRHGDSEQFVTAVLVQVSDDGSRVDLLNRGHPPPLLVSAGASLFVEPAHTALPLGLAELGPMQDGRSTIALRRGDCLLLYTDGVSEARSKTGEFFALTGCPALAGITEPDRALARLAEDVVRHVGHPLNDDAAMLLIRRP